MRTKLWERLTAIFSPAVPTTIFLSVNQHRFLVVMLALTYLWRTRKPLLSPFNFPCNPPGPLTVLDVSQDTETKTIHATSWKSGVTVCDADCCVNWWAEPGLFLPLRSTFGACHVHGLTALQIGRQKRRGQALKMRQLATTTYLVYLLPISPMKFPPFWTVECLSRYLF